MEFYSSVSREIELVLYLECYMVIHDSNPMLSALKQGIVVGVLASLNELKIKPRSSSLRQILSSQQQWTDDEIDYWILTFGVCD